MVVNAPLVAVILGLVALLLVFLGVTLGSETVLSIGMVCVFAFLALFVLVHLEC